MEIQKLKQAGKRITAVAVSGALLSTAAFGNLSNYPNNFVENGEFTGQIVVGAAAQPIDTTAAMNIIDDLRSDLTGENATERVRITYRTTSGGTDGDTLNAIRSTNQLNYGESIGNITETGGFDDADSDFLAQGRFDNDISDEDYEQSLTLLNGEFNYALRDNVDGIEEITDGVYYDSGDAFAMYTIELDNSISLDNADFDEDLIGSELTIMGNQFTIANIDADSNDDLSSLTLLGGANTVSVGEGENVTVTVDDEEYDISVTSVSSNEVLLSINGDSQTIDEFDTEEVGGVTVAVTDLVPSSRDPVRGYAELVIGGQKVTLEEGEIQINDEDLEDTYEDYDIDVSFGGSGLETITITYSVDDHTLLQEGDELEDVLFQSFSLIYRGINDVEYESFSLTSSDEAITVDGTLENGNEFPSEMMLYYTTEGSSGGDLYVGDDSYRYFLYNSSITASYEGGSVDFDGGTGLVEFDVSDTDIQDYGFLYGQDDDDQYLYVINSVDDDNLEVDFNELIQDGDESDVGIGEWDDELVDGSTYIEGNTSTTVSVDTDDLNSAQIALANGALVDFSGVEDTSLTATPDAYMNIFLDSSEVDADNPAEETDGVMVWFSFPTDTDDNLDLEINNSRGDIVNFGSLADNTDDSGDVRTYVTTYGIMIEYDNDEMDSVDVRIPDEQVYGMVDLVFGDDVAGEIQTITVDADQADERIEELEDQGYTIINRETVGGGDIEFDVSSPVLDTQVTGTSDMIVVGGPAVNRAAAQLLGLSYPAYGTASGLTQGEAVIRYFENQNSILVYGWEGEDTLRAAEMLTDEDLTGTLVNVD